MMRGHLEAIGADSVDKALVDEQDKIDQTRDIVHEIHLTPTTLTIIKNNPRSGKMEIATDVVLGRVKAETTRRGFNKTTLARSHDMSHIRVEVRLSTSGMATNLLDERSLEQSEHGPVMVQTLSTHVEHSGQHYTTTRYYLPIFRTPC